MAILSKGITLGYSATEGGEYTLLTNLQEIPEMGSNARKREKIDITTLADDEKKEMDGLLEVAETQELAFKFLHDKTQFETLVGMTEKTYFQVSLPDGIVANFSGIPSVKLSSATASTAMTYTLTIADVSEIVFA